jgi:hypothetical protein
MQTYSFEEIVKHIDLCDSVTDISRLAQVLKDEQEHYNDEEMAVLVLKLKNKSDLITLSDMGDNSVFFLFKTK